MCVLILPAKLRETGLYDLRDREIHLRDAKNTRGLALFSSAQDIQSINSTGGMVNPEAPAANWLFNPFFPSLDLYCSTF